MSKSKGEFLTVSLLEQKGYDPVAYRFFCLQSHYRKPLEFSFEALDNAVVAYNKLAKNRLVMQADNEQMAIYDATNGCYKLFSYLPPFNFRK